MSFVLASIILLIIKWRNCCNDILEDLRMLCFVSGLFKCVGDIFLFNVLVNIIQILNILDLAVE